MPWQIDDLSSITGAPTASGNPGAYMFDARATQSVVFRGSDNHVRQLWWDSPSGWHQADLSAATGAPAAASDPAGYMFDGRNIQCVAFRGTDDHINQLWWDAPGGWHRADLTAATGAPAAAGNPTGYVFPARDTQCVVYRGADGHIHQLWWDSVGGWHHSDLSALTGAPGAASDPAAYVFDARDTQCIAFRGIDNHIHQLWWDNAGGWHHADLSVATAAPAAAGNPAGYMIDTRSIQSIVYRGADGHIHQLWWDAPGGWHHDDLSAASGALAAASDPTGYMFDAQGTQHVIYRGTDNHMHELWWDATAGWHHADLSAVTGASAAASDPTGYMFDSQGSQHVAYRGADNHIYGLRWEATVAPTLFVRREVWGLESTSTFDPITLAYAKAIKVMQARPASDPTSWTYQAAVHGSFAVPPAGATWNACQHQGWFFIAWHRMYLYYFERIVRKAVLDAGGPADFAIPYWNYDRPFPSNTLPPAFRAATLPDGTSNPLFLPSPNRSAALMSGGGIPSTITSAAAALANTNFSLPSFLPTFGGGRVGPAQFGGTANLGQLEQTPHNDMHPFIGGAQIDPCMGGLMTDPRCAALDPIFWLHHANIDRLWNNWLALGGGRVNPSQAGWLNQSFVLHDETGAAVTLTGAGVVDSAAQLGYVYDDAPVALNASTMLFSMSVGPSGQGATPRPPELVAATADTLMLRGDSASVALTTPAASRASLVAAASDDDRRLFISVDNIEADQDSGLVYAVYITGPSGEKHHVGNISLFGIQEMNDPNRQHPGAPGFRHTFDVTQAVNLLRGQGAFDPDSISVTFEPIQALPPPGPQVTMAARAATLRAPQPTAPIRIGRVGLFVA